MRLLSTLFLTLILVAPTQAQLKLNTDYFKKGTLHLVNSSHQDIAWVNTFEVCRRDRAEHVMLPVLKRMAENDKFCYSVESAMYLQEFLDQYPEKYDEVLKYSQQGRLEWGATYSQPYQGLFEGEALIRQAYLGRKAMKKALPGCDFKSAWNLDVPGMCAQYPQILAKSGIPYYQISRFKTGFFEWLSPDGSSVKVVSTGQYSGYSGQVLAMDTEEKRTDALIDIVNYWGDYQKSRKIAPACLSLLSQDCTLPVNYDQYITTWNDNIKKGASKNVPIMQYSTSTMFMDDLTSNPKANFDKIVGARPDMWLYIHGPTHHKAVAASREANRSLTAAEKFSIFSSLLDQNYETYPEKTIQDAWANAIYADHGWGGYGGVGTDRMFREKFETARDSANIIAQRSIENIANKIGYNKDNLYAVTIFNPLSWERTNPVSFTLDAEGRPNNHLKIVDQNGADVPFQFTDNHKTKGNRDEAITMTFIAQGVPSMGYKTYYVAESDASTTTPSRAEFPLYENRFFRLKLGNGGIESLYDKELGSEVFNTSKFKGGELFTVKSEGTGAGEFSQVQQPTMDGFDKLSNYTTPWICVESGAVKDVFQTATQFKDTKAYIRVVVYRDIKRIDYEVDLNGYVGDNWREYRVAFPVSADQNMIVYDAPMGVVEVGKSEMDGNAGTATLQPAYNIPSRGIHPREVQDWFSASNGSKTLTISSDVAVFDWIDPTDNANSAPILQPVLISSRKSCHGMGNYYLQPGNHSYRFSIYSHANDWKSGYRSGAESNQYLGVAVVAKETMKDGSLPATYSFASIDTPNIVISALKKCEDDNSVVVRCYDIEGKDAVAKINLFKGINKVEHTNMIEEDGVQIKSSTESFEFPIKHHAIETFKIYVNN